MSTIHNPILKGFHPDPSILRVDDDYYIATSTFEWFPGVRIHHSRDLVNWELLPSALDSIDLVGNPDSGGVWAPCLTWSNGLFYLIYTNVRSLDGIFKDTPNYLVTAKKITGPWSKPVYLNSSGFDPSLFHDTDGRKWLLNMMWDYRAPIGKNPFGGTFLQEYDAQKKELVGPVKNIFLGTERGCTEAPHLYKKDGFYYLMTAEGGTSYEHCVTIARSSTIDGHYETMPGNPLIDTRDNPKHPLQKTGHGSLVEVSDGSCYVAHLAGRPLTERGSCPLGRETCMTKVEWHIPDGDVAPWLRVVGDGKTASLEVEGPALPEVPVEPIPARDEFDDRTMPLNLSSLRRAFNPSWANLRERPSFLRLYGGESPSSKFNQSLIARRVTDFSMRAETCVDFTPETSQEMAGLIWYYNTTLFHWLYISHDEKLGRVLTMLSCHGEKWKFPVGAGIAVEKGMLYLRAESNRKKLQFSWSVDGEFWTLIGPVLDCSHISDEGATNYPAPGWGFTGTFVGMQCTDLTGQKRPADFDYLDLQSI